ncbi:MAG TPA: HD domain-containing protein [Polyangiaceae bacterium]|jgi:predicted HD phosphohydrolase|nr:HD domain-containing protein [Polyangiaceae bacterium]
MAEERASFKRMDESTRDEWMTIAQATVGLQPTVADRVLSMLRGFDQLYAGFGVSQLHHALQTATMARRANASDEMVLCALCHDIGKHVSIANHAAIAAEILRPYVSDDAYQIVLTHQRFQGRHYFEHFGKSPSLRDRHRDEPWFALAERFTDEWDQAAFDPAYPVLPLAEFEPLVRATFARYPMGY